MAKTYDVYGVGHALVDQQYRVTVDFLNNWKIGKGVMTLVDENRQKELQSALSCQPENSASGGSAANTMITVSRFGGRANYAFQVGNDNWGNFYRRDLDDAGVQSTSSSQRTGSTGQCMVFITPDADRTMNSFLGTSANMSPNQIERCLIGKSQYLYLEGYLLTSDAGMETCQLAQKWAIEDGVKVSATLSDPVIVETFRDRFQTLIDVGVDLLFCNEEEALSMTHCKNLNKAIEILEQQVRTSIVTRGPDGAIISHEGSRIEISAVPVSAVDTTGAGDTLAGGVLFGITNGYSLVDSVRLGNFAAAEVVGKLGPRLDRELGREIEVILRDTTELDT